jgi:rare lipoprotein A
MRLSLRRASIGLLLALAACANNPKAPPSWPAGVKIGRPYQVAGVWYYPSDDRDYDARGIASWYGPGFHALATANGERYNQDDLTAAHKTLPMPSWVEVENLDNGRRLVVRINDRGPFVDGRIIDLSRRSAQLLGVDKAGLARVRVRRMYPDKADLPPPVVVNATPPPLPVAVVSGDITFIQVAALSDAGRIAWLTGHLGSFGPVVTEAAPSGLTRIRLGPYADADAANAVLAQLRAAGYSDSRLLTSSLPSPLPPPSRP